jgi:alpha-glucosidase
LQFWLDKGVDGFRIDVIWLMLKDDQFSDEPIDPDWDGIDPHDSLFHIYTQNLPGVHRLIKAMRSVLDEYNDRMMVGEIYLPNEERAKYYGDLRENGYLDECHLPSNFQLVDLPWEAKCIQDAVDGYYASLPLGGWPNWVLGNHDKHRVATRVGTPQARVANMLLLTLWGTPTTYYGEEIGMKNGEIPLENLQDPQAINQPEIAHIVGRDPVRTPMQWDDNPNSGFAREEIIPWLPVADDYLDRNVKSQDEDPRSMLNLYKALTTLRKNELALIVGDYSRIELGKNDLFAYKRSFQGGDDFLVVLNFKDEVYKLDLSEVSKRGIIELSTGMNRGGEVDLGSLHLGPDEGLVIRL